MSIAISNINLQEIYSLSPEDKLDLVDLIIKSMKSAVYKVKSATSSKEESWVDQFDGKWIDSRSAEEMATGIRNSRGSWDRSLTHLSTIRKVQVHHEPALFFSIIFCK